MLRADERPLSMPPPAQRVQGTLVNAKASTGHVWLWVPVEFARGEAVGTQGQPVGRVHVDQVHVGMQAVTSHVRTCSACFLSDAINELPPYTAPPSPYSAACPRGIEGSSIHASRKQVSCCSTKSTCRIRSITPPTSGMPYM